MIKDLILLKRRSLLIRLLWPVNLISTILMLSFSFTMALQHRNAAEEAIRTKATAVERLLVQIGEHLIGTKDEGSLSNYSKNLDADIQSALFYDKTNHLISESSAVVQNIESIQIDSAVHDSAGLYKGHVTISYSTRQLSRVFWGALTIACLYGFFVQLLLSAAILFVCRNVIDPLNLSFSSLSKSTLVLSDISKDISKFSESLSVGVNQQAEVVQETTAAMAEMSSTLAQTSEYATQSQSVMTSMTQTANNGMNIMNQMVDAMTSVHHANEQLKSMVNMIQEITSKTNVINDIVFKTQLLSFNASIEAARAGQHGRGFAVVAEEVGNLAKMSGKASQEIGSILLDSERQVNEIVKNTSERVQVGRQVTEQALRNFKDISNEIESIASRINNITTASREQELGVTQTTYAMRELSKTTEINNQVAQKSSSAAYVLKDETLSLHAIARSISQSILGEYSDRNLFNFRAQDHYDDRPSRKSNEGPARSTADQYLRDNNELIRKIVGMTKSQTDHHDVEDSKQSRTYRKNEAS